MQDDLEMRGKIQEIYSMTRENNAILTRMRRNQRISSVLSVLYYLVVLGFFAGAYYYVQPYVQKILYLYDQTTKTTKAVEGFQNKFTKDNLFDFLSGLDGTAKK